MATIMTMRARLLQYLRCPECGNALESAGPDALRCAGAHTFPVRGGVPRFTRDSTDTAKYFGYMWGEQADAAVAPVAASPYHLQALQDALEVPRLRGLILDAGCGEGIDLAMVALDPACEIIGVELSAGGVATSLARTRGLDRAHLVQGDLLRMPIASSTFDAAYSYGVLHHTPDPPGAVREIARTLKPGAPLLFYVYEDFSDRGWLWRTALLLANSVRVVTTRLPPALLMRLCRWLSPVVFLLFTLPSRYFRWARRLPYRHGADAWSMGGDLYDRLSAPIERRYSKHGARSLALSAGLQVIRIAQQRGWMIYAQKPGRTTTGQQRFEAERR